MHIDAEKLALYATGDEDSATVTEHIASCAECRARVTQYRRIAEAVTATPVAVPAGIADTLWSRGTTRRRHSLVRVAAFAVPLIAAGIAAIVVAPVITAQDEFRGKGASAPSSLAGIDVYRVAGEGAPAEHLGPAMHASDGLVFAYRNRGPARYLMIVAVDAAREAFWFYPAHNDPAVDPQSLPITAGDDVHLPDVVTHTLPSGRLAIYALFSTRPLHVSEVEAALTQHGEPRLDAVSEQRLDVEVRP